MAEDQDFDETGGMPPPDADTAWIQPPPGPSPLDLYIAATEIRPSFAPPDYQRHFHIYSVGRRPSRQQQAGYRSPFEFERAHGMFFRARFEFMPIPAHAMGVAYLNFHDRTYLLARRVDALHVQYRFRHSHAMSSPQRLSQFCHEALYRVGTYRPNKSRWYYFNWNRGEHGEYGERLF